MLGPIRSWQRRSKIEKVELYTRFTYYALPWFLCLGWGVLPLTDVEHRPLPLALAGTLTLIWIVQCVVTRRALGESLDHYLGRAPFPVRRLTVSAVLMGLALVAVAALVAVDGIQDPTAVLGVLFLPMPFALPYCMAVRIRVYAAVYAGITAAAIAALAAAGADGTTLVVLLPTMAGGCLMALGTSRPGAWTLGVMCQLDEARDVQARLAVAEERLRFGRDLHDVLGRNLAVIALKSELAVQLARRERPEAVEQMIEVQRIARESQREVRDVVRGYREADLRVELDGARGVLEAAGINCEVDSGDASSLPPNIQSALAWVVREATTNALRHGDARRCEVRFSVTDTHAALVVENDGADATRSGPSGSGLTGLRERLAALDGTLEAGRAAPDVFRVTAKVPVPDLVQ
ncbi:histidine kinase [Streptomyces sannanensis]|uniref:Histidine kinase n=1 Tax=Streptomyces sannanensis TaxID=285536 RepID=A0ABP6SC86_9ACTN